MALNLIFGFTSSSLASTLSESTSLKMGWCDLRLVSLYYLNSIECYSKTASLSSDLLDWNEYPQWLVRSFNELQCQQTLWRVCGQRRCQFVSRTQMVGELRYRTKSLLTVIWECLFVTGLCKVCGHTFLALGSMLKQSNPL